MFIYTRLICLSESLSFVYVHRRLKFIMSYLWCQKPRRHIHREAIPFLKKLKTAFSSSCVTSDSESQTKVKQVKLHKAKHKFKGTLWSFWPQLVMFTSWWKLQASRDECAPCRIRQLCFVNVLWRRKWLLYWGIEAFGASNTEGKNTPAHREPSVRTKIVNKIWPWQNVNSFDHCCLFESENLKTVHNWQPSNINSKISMGTLHT